MKKMIIGVATATILTMSFNGCIGSINSLDRGTTGATVQEFKIGQVVNTKKILMNDRGLTALGGAVVGAGAGALVANKEGAMVGGLVGALGGAIIGKEVIAYETFIEDTESKKVYTSFLEVALTKGTKVDYIFDGENVKRVNVLELADAKVAMQATTKEK